MTEAADVLRQLDAAGAEVRLFSGGRLVVLTRQHPIGAELREAVRRHHEAIVAVLAEGRGQEPVGRQDTLFDVLSPLR